MSGHSVLRLTLLVVCVGTTPQVLVAVPPIFDSTVAYITSDGFLSHDCDTVTLAFRIAEAVPDDTLARIDGGWLWNAGRLRLIDWREGPGWPQGDLVGATVDPASFHFGQNNISKVFDSTETILEMDFVASCLIQDPLVEVPFWFDTLGPGSTKNYFYRRVSRVYWPVHRRAGQIFLVQVSSSCGDVNEDGQVTSADIIDLVRFVFRSGVPPSGTQGDVNCDGTATASDVILMVNHVFKGGI